MVSDVPIFDGGLTEAVDACLGLLRAGNGGRVATANTDFIALARRNPRLLADLQDSNLVVADGKPVAWLARLAGASRVTRVAGVDLVPAFLTAAARECPVRVALYGGEPEIARRAANALQGMSPGIDVAAVLSPPFRSLGNDEEQSLLARLSRVDPDVVLVALGCPRQERLIAEWSPFVPRSVWLGVGGTFDFLAGKRVRAPGWMQEVGLEWLFRMAQEPGRLGRRYLGRDLPALVAIGRDCARKRLR